MQISTSVFSEFRSIVCLGNSCRFEGIHFGWLQSHWKFETKKLSIICKTINHGRNDIIVFESRSINIRHWLFVLRPFAMMSIALIVLGEWLFPIESRSVIFFQSISIVSDIPESTVHPRARARIIDVNSILILIPRSRRSFWTHWFIHAHPRTIQSQSIYALRCKLFVNSFHSIFLHHSCSVKLTSFSTNCVISSFLPAISRINYE